jgi:hypothetical protein
VHKILPVKGKATTMLLKKSKAAKHGCFRKGAKIKAKAADNQVTI